MSKSVTENTSDDEFQDAVNDLSTTNKSENDQTKPQRDIEIENLVDQQIGMKLEDETTSTIEDDVAECLEDFIDEDALRELEKTMTPEQLKGNKEKADKMKLNANELFKQDEAIQAIEIYTEALKICPTTCTKERAVLYGNRAAAKIKLDSKKSAVGDCTKAIELWPEYVRVLLRRAKLYEHEDKLEQALEDYKRVYDIDRGHQEANEALVRLPPIINERNEKLKTEAIDKLKELGNLILKPFGLSTSNFQLTKDPSGSFSVNFNDQKS